MAFTGTINRNPVAVASARPAEGGLPLAVAFDGRGSSDPDGDPLSHDWDFGDGSARDDGNRQPHLHHRRHSYREADG